MASTSSIVKTDLHQDNSTNTPACSARLNRTNDRIGENTVLFCKNLKDDDYTAPHAFTFSIGDTIATFVTRNLSEFHRIFRFDCSYNDGWVFKWCVDQSQLNHDCVISNNNPNVISFIPLSLKDGKKPARSRMTKKQLLGENELLNKRLVESETRLKQMTQELTDFNQFVSAATLALSVPRWL